MAHAPLRTGNVCHRLSLLGVFSFSVVALTLAACGSNSSPDSGAADAVSIGDTVTADGVTPADIGTPDVSVPDGTSPTDIAEPDAAPDTVTPDGSEAAECEEGETRCDGVNTLLRCTDGEFRAAVCSGGAACVEEDGGASCNLPPCTPNDIGCSDSATAYVCEADGSRTELPCRDTQFCTEGVCRDQVCVPDSVACDGTVVRSCNETGSEFDNIDCAASCPAGSTCECEAGACVTRICTPDARRCDGNQVVACSADGTEEVRTACGSDVCVGGQCLDAVCTPGDTECSGEVLTECISAAGERVLTDCAAENAYCAVRLGVATCVAGLCTPGSVTCADATTRSVCDSRGSARTSVPCAAGESCIDGSCVPQSCSAGETTCVGTRLGTCNASRTGFDVTTCSGGGTCVDGASGAACTAVICSPGTRSCSSDNRNVLTCNAAGTERNPTACLSGTACVSGSCVTQICVPGGTRCVLSNLETCDPTGTAWTSAPCGASNYCGAGPSGATCLPRVCTPDTVTGCEGNFVQRCNSIGSGYVRGTECALGCSFGVCNSTAGLGTSCPTGVCGFGFNCSNGVCAPAGTEYFPPTTSTMGTNRTDSWVNSAERPATPVTFTRGIYVSWFEVTQQQWTLHMSFNPSHFPGCGTDCPIEMVSFMDSLAYLNARSINEGLTPCYVLSGCSGFAGSGCSPRPSSGFCSGDYTCSTVTWLGAQCEGWRLPTNAEWEYFAREGVVTDYPTSNRPADVTRCSVFSGLTPFANYCANSDVTYEDCVNNTGGGGFACAGPRPVGSFAPTEAGLYDVLGNAAEYVWGQTQAYPGTALTNPTFGTGTPTTVWRRGGAWWSWLENARLTSLDQQSTTVRGNLGGLRAIRTAFPATCSNGRQDGTETAIDCGGSSCSLCP